MSNLLKATISRGFWGFTGLTIALLLVFCFSTMATTAHAESNQDFQKILLGFLTKPSGCQSSPAWEGSYGGFHKTYTGKYGGGLITKDNVHGGVDITCNQPGIAVKAGVFGKVIYKTACSLHVYVQTKDMTVIFMHMTGVNHAPNVKGKDLVAPDHLVGMVGSVPCAKGVTIGTHLHVEVFKGYTFEMAGSKIPGSHTIDPVLVLP